MLFVKRIFFNFDNFFLLPLESQCYIQRKKRFDNVFFAMVYSHYEKEQKKANDTYSQ